MSNVLFSAKMLLVTERTFGLGVGILVTAAILNKGDGDGKVESLLLTGAVIMVVSLVLNYAIRRKQITIARAENMKNLK